MYSQEIRKSSELADEAYGRQVNLDKTCLIENKDTDVQMHIGIYRKVLYVVGRGTSSIRDIFHDIQFSQSRCAYLNNTCVHTGFLKQYDSIRKDLIAEILNLYKTNEIKRIVCCGHSLGSICTLAALDIKLNSLLCVDILCITYASPRIGGKNFVKLFNKTIPLNHSFRFVYHRDPVTFLPLALRFRHVHGCVHFKKNRSIVRSDSYFFPIGCMISQHFMEHYKERASQFVSEETLYIET
jgi:hypothetical protein